MQQWLDTKLWEFDQWYDEHIWDVLPAFFALLLGLGLMAWGDVDFAQYILWDLSGLHWLSEKFSAPEDPSDAPTIAIWAFSTYLAIYALAFQKFDSRKDDVVLRANSVLSQINAVPFLTAQDDTIILSDGSSPKAEARPQSYAPLNAALAQLPETQHMWCPPKPRLSRPWIVLRCLIYQDPSVGHWPKTQEKDLHPETVDNLAAAVVRRKAELAGITLFEAKLSKANLEGANLQGTGLAGAKLVWANLQGAYLGRAYLEGANLRGAYLEGANLVGADLAGRISRERISGGRISRGRISRGQISGGRISRGQISRGRISEWRISGRRISRGRISRGRISRGRISRGRISRGRISRGRSSKGRISRRQYSISAEA